jgi:hypothetical protein
MLTAMLAALWGIAVLFAWVGWGQLGHLLLFRRWASWRDAGTIGVALLLAVGGVLNLLHDAGKAGALCCCVVGWAMAGIALLSQRFSATGVLIPPRRSGAPGLWVPVGLLLAVLLVRYAGSVVTPLHAYSVHDDLQAYAVFPVRMLQTGSIGNDPFNERRLFTYGGVAFLEVFTLAFTRIENLNLCDLGLGTFLLILTAAELFKRWRVPPKLGLWGLVLFALIPPTQVDMNLSGCVIPAALILRLVLVFSDGFGISQMLLAGLLMAGLVSMKATLAAPTGLFAAIFFILAFVRFKRARPRIVLGLLAALAVFVLLLAPWAWTLRLSSGTFFYPLLGKGFHATAYGFFKPPIAAMTPKRFIKVLLVAAFPAVITLGCLVLRLVKGRRGVAAFSLLIGSVLGALAIGIATAGSQMERHLFGYYFASLLLGGLLLWQHGRQREWTNGTRGFAAILGASTLAMIGLSYSFYPLTFAAIRDAFHPDSYASDEFIAHARAFQDAAPPGAILLTRLAYPLYLDFRRNPIYVADWPGIVSPPPGMPVFKGPEPLASYLVGHGYRYVAYSYGNEADFGAQEYAYRLVPSFHLWIRNQAEATFDFQKNLTTLSTDHRHLFDDGTTYLLDLDAMTAPSSTVPTSDPR